MQSILPAYDPGGNGTPAYNHQPSASSPVCGGRLGLRDILAHQSSGGPRLNQRRSRPFSVCECKLSPSSRLPFLPRRLTYVSDSTLNGYHAGHEQPVFSITPHAAVAVAVLLLRFIGEERNAGLTILRLLQLAWPTTLAWVAGSLPLRSVHPAQNVAKHADVSIPVSLYAAMVCRV